MVKSFKKAGDFSDESAVIDRSRDRFAQSRAHVIWAEIENWLLDNCDDANKITEDDRDNLRGLIFRRIRGST